jgi:hypothetical protein
MSFDVEEHVRYHIANAEVRPYPFPHFYVRPVFPEPFYKQLLERLPPTTIMKNISEAGRVGQKNDAGRADAAASQPRWITDLATIEEHEEKSGNDGFWRSFSSWLLGTEFQQLIMSKFRVGISERFGAGSKLATDVEARFVRDFTKYSIGPHTDMPRKLISLLFYVAKDEVLRDTGTSLFVPRDPAFSCDGTRWYKFKSFKKTATMEFVPNALFAFLKTDRSFHGVEEINHPQVERNVLLYNVYVNKVITAQPAGAVAKWWPWARRSRN